MTGQAPRRRERRDRGRLRIGRSRLALEHLEGRALPSFVAPAEYAAGTNAVALATADFTGDGQIDLAVINQTTPGKVNILVAHSGNFLPAQSYPAGGSANSVAVADFSGD